MEGQEAASRMDLPNCWRSCCSTLWRVAASFPLLAPRVQPPSLTGHNGRSVALRSSVAVPCTATTRIVRKTSNAHDCWRSLTFFQPLTLRAICCFVLLLCSCLFGCSGFSEYDTFPDSTIWVPLQPSGRRQGGCNRHRRALGERVAESSEHGVSCHRAGVRGVCALRPCVGPHCRGPTPVRRPAVGGHADAHACTPLSVVAASATLQRSLPPPLIPFSALLSPVDVYCQDGCAH
jgi:hypothetical protein